MATQKQLSEYLDQVKGTTTIHVAGSDRAEESTRSQSSTAEDAALIARKSNGDPYFGNHPRHGYGEMSKAYESEWLKKSRLNRFLWMFSTILVASFHLYLLLVWIFAIMSLWEDSVNTITVFAWTWITWAALIFVGTWYFIALGYAIKTRGSRAEQYPPLDHKAGGVFWRMLILVAIGVVIQLAYTADGNAYSSDNADRWRDIMWGTLLGTSLILQVYVTHWYCHLKEMCHARCDNRCYDY